MRPWRFAPIRSTTCCASVDARWDVHPVAVAASPVVEEAKPAHLFPRFDFIQSPGIECQDHVLRIDRGIILPRRSPYRPPPVDSSIGDLLVDEGCPAATSRDIPHSDCASTRDHLVQGPNNYRQIIAVGAKVPIPSCAENQARVGRELKTVIETVPLMFVPVCILVFEIPVANGGYSLYYQPPRP